MIKMKKLNINVVILFLIHFTYQRNVNRYKNDSKQLLTSSSHVPETKNKRDKDVDIEIKSKDRKHDDLDDDITKYRDKISDVAGDKTIIARTKDTGSLDINKPVKDLLDINNMKNPKSINEKNMKKLESDLNDDMEKECLYHDMVDEAKKQAENEKTDKESKGDDEDRNEERERDDGNKKRNKKNREIKHLASQRGSFLLKRKSRKWQSRLKKEESEPKKEVKEKKNKPRSHIILEQVPPHFEPLVYAEKLNTAEIANDSSEESSSRFYNHSEMFPFPENQQNRSSLYQMY